MKCHACTTLLTGGTDTFGSIHKPLCQSCWWRLVECAPKYVTEVVHSVDGASNLVTVKIRRVLVSEKNEAEYDRLFGGLDVT